MNNNHKLYLFFHTECKDQLIHASWAGTKTSFDKFCDIEWHIDAYADFNTFQTTNHMNMEPLFEYNNMDSYAHLNYGE